MSHPVDDELVVPLRDGKQAAPERELVTRGGGNLTYLDAAALVAAAFAAMATAHAHAAATNTPLDEALDSSMRAISRA